MKIIVNGKSETGDYGTVWDLLAGRDLDPEALVVELNGKIIPRDEYADVSIKDGDTIEIVQFVAGG